MILELYDQNLNDRNFIEKTHKLRDQLMLAIQNGDQMRVKEIREGLNYLETNDRLQLSKRIPGNELRSVKNLMLSHNTLYGYAAEKGGLHPSESHYLTEKNSIIIEHASSIDELNTLHRIILDEFSDLEKRFSSDELLPLTEKVANYIQINFNENDTVKEIAEVFAVNASHLMRQFKKDYNTTIIDYRNNKRINEAKKLLSFSNLLITDITFIIGFNTSQYFSRVFKNKTERTPSDFRNENKIKQ